MKISKKIIPVLGAALMAASITGCQGEGTGPGPGPGPDPIPPTPSKSVKIDFWHTFGDKVESALLTEINEFTRLVKENEDVDVTVDLLYRGNYDATAQAIVTSLSGGDSPTLAIAYPDSVSDFMKLEGGEKGKYVVDLAKFIENKETTFGTDRYLGDTSSDIDDFYQTFYEEGTKYIQPGMYSFPYMKSTEIMLYNRTAVIDMLEFYNEEYYKPTHGGKILTEGELDDYMNSISWDDLMNMAQCIRDNAKSIAPSVLQKDKYPVLYDSDSNLFISKLLQNNISYSGIKNGKGYIGFKDGEDRQKAEALVAKWQDAHNKMLFSTKGSKGTYSSNDFKEESTIFVIGSSGGSGYSFPETGSFELGFARVPVDNDNPQYVTQGPTFTMLTHPRFTAEENAMKQKYAWKLIKYLTSTDVNTALCCNGSEGYLPVRKSSTTTPIFDEYLKDGGNYSLAARCVLNNIQDFYFNTSIFPGSATLRDQAGAIVTEAFANQLSISKIFDKAIESTELVID